MECQWRDNEFGPEHDRVKSAVLGKDTPTSFSEKLCKRTVNFFSLSIANVMVWKSQDFGLIEFSYENECNYFECKKITFCFFIKLVMFLH